jgi:hypothetical protein
VNANLDLRDHFGCRAFSLPFRFLAPAGGIISSAGLRFPSASGERKNTDPFKQELSIMANRDNLHLLAKVAEAAHAQIFQLQQKVPQSD